MGRWHASELRRAGGALVAVTDLDQAAATQLAATEASARAFPDLETLLATARPDAVHVCTPTESHASIVESALDHRTHVLVEKPLAEDAATTERLLAEAERRELYLCPVHQYLFQSGMERARRALPRLGRLVQVEVTACSAGGLFAPGTPLDRVAADILPHALAVLQSLLPAGVDALEWTALHPREGELRAAAEQMGAAINICVSMNGRPTRNELRAIGERGTVHIDFFHGYAVVQGGSVSRARKLAEPFASSGSRIAAAAVNLGRRTLRWEPAYPGLRTLIERFYDSVRSGGPPPLAFRDTLAVAKARDRLLEITARDARRRREPSAG
jgi:predicted dehydrogenase